MRAPRKGTAACSATTIARVECEWTPALAGARGSGVVAAAAALAASAVVASVVAEPIARPGDLALPSASARRSTQRQPPHAFVAGPSSAASVALEVADILACALAVKARLAPDGRGLEQAACT